MKKFILTLTTGMLSVELFAHEYNHDAELFSQILFPIALVGVLASVPLAYVLLASSYDKKMTRIIYGAYALASVAFFGLLRFLYTFIHNHFEMACTTIAIGLYIGFFSVLAYLVRLIIYKIKSDKLKKDATKKAC